MTRSSPKTGGSALGLSATDAWGRATAGDTVTLYPIAGPHNAPEIAAGAGRYAMAQEDHWLPAFNFNVKE
jgi:hypothetical protein